MAGIAGVCAFGGTALTRTMLDRLAHRGRHLKSVVMGETATLGAVWSESEPAPLAGDGLTATDSRGNGHFARVSVTGDALALERDPLGVVPLYSGLDSEDVLCFASEVKALLAVTDDVNEVQPGPQPDLRSSPLLTRPPATLSTRGEGRGEDSTLDASQELRRRLAAAVEGAVGSRETGAWLSGGLDSSAIAALARPLVARLHTFAAGLAAAPDLEYAREVARHIGSTHHEVVIRPEQLVPALPDVIYHLESFDALLVRSSIANFLAGRAAAGFVPDVLSGEGGDELFAGYDYLKALDPVLIADELFDITGRLHNTALQRVDRCSAAHGVVAHVPFLDPEVAGFALGLDPALKIRDGVEKWVLRQAVADVLPARVLNRPKAKFWQGAGIGELLAEHAEAQVSDSDFRRERLLPGGTTLNTKEELLYYRIFRERFGRCRRLDWMGRTKGAPAAPPS